MFDLYEEFKAIITALSDNEIDYAVCGGWAMAIHGAPRATVDIDLLIMSDSLDEAMSIARGCNYSINGLPLSLHGGQVEIRRISKIDPNSGIVLTLDLLLVTEELKNVWENRQRVNWQNSQISVVSRDGLIKLKTLGGRTQDLADIERLEELENES